MDGSGGMEGRGGGGFRGGLRREEARKRETRSEENFFFHTRVEKIKINKKNQKRNTKTD
jgi:hypothetical protein